MHRLTAIGALVLMSAGLGGTVFRAQVAQGADHMVKMFVTNDASHPVPTREQNLDAAGNIKVHEQGTANVNVTNSSLPVTGTINVANLPGTQNISGTVNVGNFPAIQQVAGSVSNADQTSVFTDATISGQGSGSVQLINNANVKSAREVRLSIWCSGSSSCSNVGVDVWADGKYLVDQFGMNGSGYSTSFVNKVYDVPGTSLSVALVNIDSAMTFATELVGRSN